MSRTPVTTESRVPRVRVLVHEGSAETPLHTLSLPAAATVGDLRRHIGLVGPLLFDRRFNGGVPTGDGMRLGDLQDDTKEVHLEVRLPGARRASGGMPSASARSEGHRLPGVLWVLVLVTGAVVVGLSVSRYVSSRRPSRRSGSRRV